MYGITAIISLFLHIINLESYTIVKKLYAELTSTVMYELSLSIYLGPTEALLNVTWFPAWFTAKKQVCCIRRKLKENALNRKKCHNAVISLHAGFYPMRKPSRKPMAQTQARHSRAVLLS